MTALAFELEDSMHRTRDYLRALYATLGQPTAPNILAAQRVLCDAIEAHEESEALRIAAADMRQNVAA